MVQHFDVLIKNASIIDGTGAPGYTADIGVIGERIVAIGPLHQANAELEIDASNKAAAPGFIDAHTHDDRLLLSAPDMAPKVSQGVTTVVAGNCGISLAPMPGGCAGSVTPPLDLLDNTGTWYRFAKFRDYVEELRSRPAATPSAVVASVGTGSKVAAWSRLASRN